MRQLYQVISNKEWAWDIVIPTRIVNQVLIRLEQLPFRQKKNTKTEKKNKYTKSNKMKYEYANN